MQRISAVLPGIALSVLLAAGCASYSKKCADGVCEITENGVTRYEGDPQKIAELKARKNAAAKAFMETKAKLDKAPRRAKSEPLRVALFPTHGEGEELAELAGQYHKMLRSELSRIKGVQLVDDGKVAQAMNTAAQMADPMGSRSSFGKSTKPDLKFDEETMQRLWAAGIDADVVLSMVVRPKTKTGLVGGRGNGAGLAQVTLVEFDVKFTSLYDYRELNASTVGKSTSNFAVAGLDKKGKAASGELKFKRNTKLDQPVVKQFAASIHSTMSSKIRPKLPSLAAIRKAEPQQRQPASAQDAAKALKNMLGF